MNKMFDTVCCILMYFFMFVKLYKFIIRIYKSFFSIPNLFIFSISMHADIHAQTDMSVLKKYGKKRPDRDVPRIYVLGRNDPEPNCSFTNFM